MNRFIILLIFPIIINQVFSQTTSSDCTIKDGIQIHTYEFNNLSRSDIKIWDNTTKETIYLRLCSSLMNKCGGREDYSICLKKNDTEIGIGKSPLKLRNVDHTLVFDSTGDICQGDKNYTVVIRMKCDYSVAENSTPILSPKRVDPCKINMIWKTKYACIRAVTTNCSISDQYKNTFDLSPLTKSSDNYIVKLDKKGKTKMLINVCHSIIHEKGATCSRPVGACLVNSTDVNITYANNGEPEKNSLVIENNILKLKYTNGDFCFQDADHFPSHQTTISFICDPQATGNTEPKFSDESKPCDYKFTWKTAAACNKTSLNPRSVENTKCTVADPETKFQFNLETLMNRDIAVNSTNNSQYKLQICGPVRDATCPEGTGICDMKNRASAGSANANLMWTHGGPYLNYTDGVSCGNGLKHYTLIAFVCGVKGSEGLPIILKDEPCYLKIYWYTDLACDKTNSKKIMCAENQTSLIPLIRTTNNYVVKALGTEFHINICRPVVPTPGLACPHGSAVCQAVPNANGQYTNEISLGFPDQNQVLGGDQNLILNYYGGSPCTENPLKNISSSFHFACDYKGDVGQPEYKSYSDCHYIFEWKTNIVCSAVVGKWFSPCTIKDTTIKDPYEVNLSLLYKQPVPRFVGTKGKNYSINLCGGKEHCNGSVVCEETNGYGTFSQVTFDYRSKSIKLQYSNGTKCSKESYASEFSLICNYTAGIGDPVLKLDANCIALFEWQTAVACPGGTPITRSSEPANITTESNTASNLTPVIYNSMQTWVVSITLIIVVLVLGIWLYLRNPRRCSHLRSRITTITATKNHSRVQYSRVNTTEEARLLLDATDPCTDNQIDSDDELLGV